MKIQKMSKISTLGDSISNAVEPVSGRRVTGFFHPKRIVYNITVK